MADTTTIEWADATWNPWWGCAKVSPGCANCYAEALANRFYNGLWRGQRRRMQNWNLPAKVDRRAARKGRRLRLFVASMADIFDDHPAVVEWRAEALRLLAGLRNVDVLLLTKRPENILRMVPPEWLDAWPAHVWVGATVEDQPRADERIPHLLRVPARVRFLSIEPMLGPVRLDTIAMPSDGVPGCVSPLTGEWWPALGNFEVEARRKEDGHRRIDWVIAGGESGPRARPSHPDWYRSARDQCAQSGVAFLFKQWGDWVSDRDKPFRTDLRTAAWVAPDGRWGSIQPQPDGAAWVARIGKAAAGRLLDGRTHDGFPEVTCWWRWRRGYGSTLRW